MATPQTNKSKNYRYKRWFDLSILLLAHLLLLPIWLLLWIAIPLIIWLSDRGPIIYRQKRIGKDGHAFHIRKFRTMIPDADTQGPVWTTQDDPRVTPVGKLLRRTALDELPGILSIWKGDMSLVGPRALDVGEHLELERQVPGFADRLQILPGLTGLAQLYDPDDDAVYKFRYDMEYIQRMGPWLDLKLLILSVHHTLTGKWDQRGGKPEGERPTPGPTDEEAKHHEPSVGGHVKSDQNA